MYMYMYIQTQIPAYKTAQMADRRSGRYIHTSTNPCLQDRTDGRSPVREIHTYKHKSLPTRPHRWQIAGQGDTYIQTQIPAYKTAQMADRRSGRYIQCTYKHKSLPTRPHRWQIAGQGDTYIQTQIPAYKTAQMGDRRSGRYIHVHCTYKHKSLPTRPHRWQIAGQGDTCTYMYIQTQIPAYKTAQTVGRRSGRYNVHVHTYMYKHKSLPTRPHRWQVAGQGGTHTYNYIHVHAQYMNPQLQDHIDNRSMFRQTHKNQLPRKRQPPLDLMIGCTS